MKRIFALLLFPFVGEACTQTEGAVNTPVEISAAKVAGVFPEAESRLESAPSELRVTFSEPMDVDSLNPASFTLFRGGNQIAGSVFSDGAVARFVPSSVLPSNTSYTGNITSTVRDSKGRSLAGSFSWRFSVVPNLVPTVLNSSPCGIENSALDAEISVTFSEDMDPASLETESPVPTITLLEIPTNRPMAGSVEYVDGSRKAIFFPSDPVQPNSQYRLTVRAQARDLTGLTLPADFVCEFQSHDTTPPELLSFSPAPAPNAPIQLPSFAGTFSEKLAPSSITPSSLTFQKVPGDLYEALSASYDPQTISVTWPQLNFGPLLRLDLKSRYRATIYDSIRDVHLNRLLHDYSLEFETRSGWLTDDGIQLPELVENLSTSSDMVRAAFDSDREVFVLIWRQSESVARVYSNQVGTGTPDPTDSVLVTEGDAATSSIDNLQLAYNLVDKAVYALWTRQLSTDIYPIPYVAKRSPGGAWGEPKPVGNGGGDVLTPKMAIGTNGRVYVAWLQAPNGNVGFSVFINSIASGAEWDPNNAVEIDPDAGVLEARDVDIAVDAAGELHAVWRQKLGTGGTNFSVIYNYSVGGNWIPSNAIDIDNTPGQGTRDVLAPKIAIAQDQSVHVAYAQKKVSGNALDAYARRKRTDGTWEANTLIEDSDSYTSGNTVINLSLLGSPDGSVVAIWGHKLSSADTPSTVVNRRLPGEAWVSTLSVDQGRTGWHAIDDDGANSTAAAKDAQLAADSRGNMIAVWQQGQGGNSVFARRFTPNSGWDPGSAQPIDADGRASDLVIDEPRVFCNHQAGFFLAAFLQRKQGSPSYHVQTNPYQF